MANQSIGLLMSAGAVLRPSAFLCVGAAETAIFFAKRGTVKQNLNFYHT